MDKTQWPLRGPEEVRTFFVRGAAGGRGKEVLLVRAGEGEAWKLPGGAAQGGEGTDECVLRTGWEEVGVVVKGWHALRAEPGRTWVMATHWQGDPEVQEGELRWATTDWVFGGGPGSPDRGDQKQDRETPLETWRAILAAEHVFPEGPELTDEATLVFLREAEAELAERGDPEAEDAEDLRW